jgi:hypothetical protein
MHGEEIVWNVNAKYHLHLMLSKGKGFRCGWRRRMCAQVYKSVTSTVLNHHSLFSPFSLSTTIIPFQPTTLFRSTTVSSLWGEV